jgi:TonB family protein
MVCRAARLFFVACLSLPLVCASPALAQSKDQPIVPPKKIKNVEAVYPAAAQQARLQGTVKIEATIGTDGKVRDAKVVTPVPLLDEAALAAVRQWEYEPATMDGVPVQVVMTVTVTFALQETHPPSTGPTVLDRSGSDWTLNGTPLMDDDLTFWLDWSRRREPDLELSVHADPSSTYADLVQILASATAAGVKRLNVFVGAAAPAAAVHVWLEPTTTKVTGATLPVADVPAATPSSAGVAVTIPRAGPLTSAKTSLQRAPANAVVRLRVDRARRMAEVWDVLRLGAAKSIAGFALAVQSPAHPLKSAPTAQQQREWQQVQQSLPGVLGDKPFDQINAERIPILEKFVAKNPNIVEARFKLAQALSARGESASATAEGRERDSRAAVRHDEAVLELSEDPDVRFLVTWDLVELFGRARLSEDARARAYAERLVEELPERANAYVVYAKTLYDTGDLVGAANAIRKGRAATSMPVTGQLLQMQYSMEQVLKNRSLPSDVARGLLDEVIGAADAIIAVTPDVNAPDYRTAAIGKSYALSLKAERVPADRQQRIAWLAESDRWDGPFDTFANGQPPPPHTLTSREIDDLEWNALRFWNGQLEQEGHRAEAIAAYEKYAAQRPRFSEVHEQLGGMLVNAAGEATDASAKSALRERAAAAYQKAFDVAGTATEWQSPFFTLLDLYGPKQLNRPQSIESLARAMLKREPDNLRAHYIRAAALLRMQRSKDAEKALRDARGAVKGNTPSRARMASYAVDTLMEQGDLPPATLRPIFDEANALLVEAEKVKGSDSDPDVLFPRAAWLKISGERFETDPARAAAQRERAQQLAERAKELLKNRR